MTIQRVLVVDDEPKMSRVLEIMLKKMGYEVTVAGDGRAALTLMDTAPVDLVITDLRMPGMDGLQLLTALREHGLDVPVIIMTAYGTVESAVQAMKQGAFDYIVRPFDVDAVELIVTRALSVRRVQRENLFLREELDKGWDEFVGRGPAITDVYEQIRQVAPGQTSVLITGESGTGKELAAHAIHRASPRRESLFVSINCAAIPADMLESELFGHTKGAFTGAYAERVGKFELADGGTLFLDEVAEMPTALQAKLLRALQEHTIERLGSNRPISVDLRVIAATNQDVHQALQRGNLREDLYYRLNVFRIDMPPLRRRREDIPLLVEHFLDKHGRKLGLTSGGLSHTALTRLQEYSWPGNVRELANIVERAIVLCHGGRIEVSHLPKEIAGATPSVAPPEQVGPASIPSTLHSFTHAVEEFEKGLLADALARVGGNKAKAARLLDISERTLWYKVKKYGLT
ncbi:MAG: sigma-54-dependent transcriptional regulator [Candidatus Binatia bacterium]